MFEGIIYTSILEAKEKIDFILLKFPIYRKSKNHDEWYRFDSTKNMVSIRKDNVVGVGICDNTPEDIFVKLYSFEEECSEEEFDRLLKDIINKLLAV